jgi:hypothetical protein
MAAIGTAITAEVATVGSWDNATVGNRKPLDDILLGIQAIEALNLGYRAGHPRRVAEGVHVPDAQRPDSQMRKRETSDNPVYTGMIETVANLTVIKTPNLPVITSAWILDSTQLGGMADEMDGPPATRWPTSRCRSRHP